MNRLRIIARKHANWALLFVMLALALKAAVPAGFMLTSANNTITVAICADASGDDIPRKIVIPTSPTPPQSKHAGDQTGGTCSWAASGLGVISSVAPLIVLALVFILLLGLAPIAPPAPRAVFRLRPPLRGPPALP